MQLSSSGFVSRVSRFWWVTRRLRFPFVVLSSVLVAWLAPGLLGLWFAALFILFGLLPRPLQVRRPPVRRAWSPAGQRWLRQQRRSLPPPARVYVLWSESQWQARSAALPFQRRQRFFARGPV